MHDASGPNPSAPAAPGFGAESSVEEMPDDDAISNGETGGGAVQKRSALSLRSHFLQTRLGPFASAKGALIL
jgi:hypothetical protein